MYLSSNAISDVSPLSRLTQLEYLDLRYNRISDIAPLVALNLTGTQWNNTGLDLRGNPLNNEAIQTHIPAMQAKGIEVKYDPRVRVHLPRPIVQVFYRSLHGSPERPNVDAEIDGLIKKAQLFFADEMERHGFGRKTFQIEVDASGNTVVHRKETDIPREAFVVVMEEDPHPQQEVCGLGGSGGSNKGTAWIYCWGWITLVHELGHAFGLSHDFRNDRYIMSYGGGARRQLSRCAAEWLDVHRAFNPSRTGTNGYTAIEMLPPTFDAPPNAIRLRFNVIGLDELHQAQLHTPLSLVSCKALNGSKETIVEFVTTDLASDHKSITLGVIDVNGYFNSPSFPIDITSLLPPAETISMPDINLAAAVQEQIGSITTHSILNLQRFDARNGGITDLTGLEHALNSTALWLDNNNISDISALSGLKNLNRLQLNNNAISDVSPLLELTNLIDLGLQNNPLSYVSINTHIPAMLAKGIKIEYDNVAHPALYAVSGNGQEGLAGSVLSTPFVVEAQDADGEPNEKRTHHLHRGNR